MKTYLFLILLGFFLLGGCKKNNNSCSFQAPTVTATQAERTYIENYLSTNSIAAQQHPAGFFYKINNPGSGATANVCSVVKVRYSGFLFSGSLFDSYTGSGGTSFVLGQLIAGWQLGIPVIKPGGSITLYIPPSLGYGDQPRRDQAGNIVIPANSYLKFDIELLDVQ
ncbi:MAG: FKBP-type peptidyl-prolyl cis-trans isomerase [Ferruginibacter sp.]